MKLMSLGKQLLRPHSQPDASVKAFSVHAVDSVENYEFVSVLLISLELNLTSNKVAQSIVDSSM